MAGNREVPFSMEEIFDFMGVDYWRYARGRERFNIPCPICDRGSSSRNHLNVNLTKKMWRCPKCGSYGDGVNYYHLVTHGRYELSANEYAKTIEELQKAMHGNVEYHARRASADTYFKKEKQIKSSVIASDDVLDQTFSMLLQFPAFALLDEHRQNLLNRGLDEEAILRNGYRSFPIGVEMDKFISSNVRIAYKRNEWEKARKQQPRLRRMGDIAIMVGLTVGAWLKQKGCTMEGVPGFFRFQGRWCFLIPDQGIVIPTRNMKGQIVALQVRTNKGPVRYLTVSANGLELGVSENISRVHWPLENDFIEPDYDDERPEVLITEGPLKADVAIHLLKERDGCPPTAFAAIQGVMNTSALMRDCDELVNMGYTTVTNALDMDRLTNINVLNGSRRLNQLLAEKGLKFKQFFWDQECAIRTAKALRTVCAETPGVVLPERISRNPFAATAQYTVALADANCSDKVVDWSSDTKGIDDYLKSEKSKNNTH